MYGVPVGEIEMSVEMPGEAGQNTLRGKQTISKGCKENGRTQGQLKTAQEKICQYEAEMADAVSNGKKAKRKQGIRTKHNLKMSSKIKDLCMYVN